MIRLLITDIGGTLMRTDEAIISCIEEVFRRRGITPGSREKMIDVFGTSVYDYIRSYLPEGSTADPNQLYEEFIPLYPETVLPLLQVYEGVEETLRMLRANGVKIAVLSCMERESVAECLSVLRFKDFVLVRGIEDYGHRRPQPDGILLIADELGIPLSDVAYIGDTASDELMAKNAGVLSIAVRTGLQKEDRIRSAEPDAVIDSFAEVVGVLGGRK